MMFRISMKIMTVAVWCLLVPPYLVSGQSCSGDLEWHDCGSPCTYTCANPDIECIEVCEPRCECPANTLWHEGSCISTNLCPQCTDTVIQTCTAKCATKGLLPIEGTECGTCQCVSICKGYQCSVGYICDASMDIKDCSNPPCASCKLCVDKEVKACMQKCADQNKKVREGTECSSCTCVDVCEGVQCPHNRQCLSRQVMCASAPCFNVPECQDCTLKEKDSCGQKCADNGLVPIKGTECTTCHCVSVCKGHICDDPEQVCQAIEVQCIRAPCFKVPQCQVCDLQKKEVCGLGCLEKGEKPRADTECGDHCHCVSVCEGFKCDADEECSPQEVQCVTTPCYLNPTCVTKEKKCHVGEPLVEDGKEIFCGRGTGRSDCPSDYECAIEPTDQWAVCCPTDQCSGGMVWKSCGSPCTQTCINYKDLVCADVCTKTCQCPQDTPIWHNGKCIHSDNCPTELCTGDLKWNLCGLPCTLTCENYQVVDCKDTCTPRCECPPGRHLFYSGRCIAPDLCPACNETEVDKCKKNCAALQLVPEVGTECNSCVCADVCQDYNCPAEYICNVQTVPDCPYGPPCLPKPNCVGMPCAYGPAVKKNGQLYFCDDQRHPCASDHYCQRGPGTSWSVCCPKEDDIIPAGSATLTMELPVLLFWLILIFTNA